MLRSDPVLHRAVLRLFRWWDDGLRAAGIDPAKHRIPRRWTREAVIQRIQERVCNGEPVSSVAVQDDESRLSAAARRWFSTWRDALEAAGVSAAVMRPRVPNWTQERVIARIQEMHRAGDPVNHYALRHNSITHVAKKLFGCWDNAVRAAGLNPAAVRLYREPWTPDEVLDEIRRKYRQGEPLNQKDVKPYSLRRRGKIFFGSWDATLAAAGLDANTIRQKPIPKRCRRNH